MHTDTAYLLGMAAARGAKTISIHKSFYESVLPENDILILDHVRESYILLMNRYLEIIEKNEDQLSKEEIQHKIALIKQAVEYKG